MRNPVVMMLALPVFLTVFVVVYLAASAFIDLLRSLGWL